MIGILGNISLIILGLALVVSYSPLDDGIIRVGLVVGLIMLITYWLINKSRG